MWPGAAATGRSTRRPSSPPPRGSTALAAADLNGDGRPDLAIADDAGVEVVLARGDGTFGPQALVVSAGPSPPTPGVPGGSAFPPGTTGSIGSIGSIAGAGGTVPGLPGGLISLPNGGGQPEGVLALVAADFDGDGRVDLAFADAAGVEVARGRGDGTFDPPTSIAVGAGAGALVAADLNGDGRPDLAFTSDLARPSAGEAVEVALNRGGGAFAAPMTVETGQAVGALTAADFNGDRIPDLAYVALDPNTGLISMELARGLGGGRFAPPTAAFGALDLGALIAADLNGDGRPDLAYVEVAPDTIPTSVSPGGGTGIDTLRVALGRGDLTFDTPDQGPASETVGRPIVADVNGDGIPDLISTNYVDYTFPGVAGVEVALGRGTRPSPRRP